MAITFTTATDSTSVTVNDTNHGAIAGDFVIFSNSSTGNSTLNTQLDNEFSITSIEPIDSSNISATINNIDNFSSEVTITSITDLPSDNNNVLCIKKDNGSLSTPVAVQNREYFF